MMMSITVYSYNNNYDYDYQSKVENIIENCKEGKQKKREEKLHRQMRMC